MRRGSGSRRGLVLRSRQLSLSETGSVAPGRFAVTALLVLLAPSVACAHTVACTDGRAPPEARPAGNEFESAARILTQIHRVRIAFAIAATVDYACVTEHAIFLAPSAVPRAEAGAGPFATSDAFLIAAWSAGAFVEHVARTPPEQAAPKVLEHFGCALGATRVVGDDLHDAADRLWAMLPAVLHPPAAAFHNSIQRGWAACLP